ncbi:hypothetical protein FOXG_22511 [Fusarium oxysporum f. sp. lycopersici 4287]|uniref:Uncharacterized protein n=1 Tax=Fusarium oxysporum f. sp. lycopersici (strain 4287 / CBS 123668 / FGSC 9935 / NRRL 34936) TaxID=426428 RepID=A0A0J9W8X4_FUSO4|nr:hypothetical protein FOXG_22511 [Fusarium oxysporum f. sp. lycopersici 4287]KNB19283.1 hypothetical protein FOXG_22511 [Fusarium oxysporum f. sp. lycopersici 4287]
MKFLARPTTRWRGATRQAKDKLRPRLAAALESQGPQN